MNTTNIIRGEKHKNAKMTPRRVIALRRARAKGNPPPSYAVLGTRFQISAQVAHGICRGDRWPHVGGPLAGPSKAGRRSKVKPKATKRAA